MNTIFPGKSASVNVLVISSKVLIILGYLLLIYIICQLVSGIGLYCVYQSWSKQDKDNRERLKEIDINLSSNMKAQRSHSIEDLHIKMKKYEEKHSVFIQTMHTIRTRTFSRKKTNLEE